jgi:hypothetical protein
MFDTLGLCDALRNPQPGRDCLILIQSTRKFLASDERDKIYAILGVANNIPPTFTIDYSKSVTQICQDLTVSLVTSMENLDALRYCCGCSGELGSSWAISIKPPPPNPTSEGGWVVNSGHNLYNASGKPAAIKFNSGKSYLLCKGASIGLLTQVIGPFSSYIDPEDLRRRIKSIHKDSEIPKLMEFARATGKTRSKSFWRTLLMNSDRRGDYGQVTSPPSKELEAAYKWYFEGLEAPLDIDSTAFDNLKGRFTFFTHNIVNRCFFITDTGYMGLGSYYSQPGDLAVVLLGGEFCFTLRPDGQYFRLVGDAYVHDAMNGEMIKEDEHGNIMNLKDFELC